jgi:hypothetical protein
VRAKEFEKVGFISSRYALVVGLAVGEGRSIEDSLAEAGPLLLEWFARRKKCCTLVTLVVSTPTTLRGDVRDGVERWYREDLELAPLLETVEVTLRLLGPVGDTLVDIPIM